jgi:hypothetical protein
MIGINILPWKYVAPYEVEGRHIDFCSVLVGVGVVVVTHFGFRMIERRISLGFLSYFAICLHRLFSRSYQILVTLRSHPRSQGSYQKLACLHHKAINFRWNVFISWHILILDIISVVSSFGDLDLIIKVTRRHFVICFV